MQISAWKAPRYAYYVDLAHMMQQMPLESAGIQLFGTPKSRPKHAASGTYRHDTTWLFSTAYYPYTILRKEWCTKEIQYDSRGMSVGTWFWPVSLGHGGGSLGIKILGLRKRSKREQLIRLVRLRALNEFSIERQLHNDLGLRNAGLNSLVGKDLASVDV